MPTPIKYDNPGIRSAYQQVEQMAADRLLAMLPDELTEDYRPLLTDGDPEVHALVKAADRLSAYIKCVEELKAGQSGFQKGRRTGPGDIEGQPFASSGVFYGALPAQL